MKTIIAALAILFGVTSLFAQVEFRNGAEYCSMKRMKRGTTLQKISSATSPVHSYDVLRYSLNLDLYKNFSNPFPHSFTATNTITLRIDSASSGIMLHAVKSSLTIQSVTLGKKTLAFAQDPIFATITLDTLHNPEDTLVLRIAYQHNDVADGSFNVGSDGMVFTDAEPEGARYWFPCWDSPADKALLDLTAKVPGSVLLGSNGRLADSAKNGDTITYHWVSRDPISTYLVVISAKISYRLDLVYWHPAAHPQDSIPFRFYSNAGENNSSIRSRIGMMTSRYSELFGEHPFEKNGFATLNGLFYWGGMENQTLTSLCTNCWGENLVSHEFAHQWFGDMITCATWADVWLNEGFATYCESLWYEYTSGYPAYKSAIERDAAEYIALNKGWAMYDPNWAITTPDVNTLFDLGITYDKGACVLHMLRYVLGDSTFFAAIKAYATDTANFRLKTATTNDFIAKINNVTGQDLNWFFDAWVKKPNYPVYANEFSIDPGQKSISFLARQTQKTPPLFQMPVELRVSFTKGPDSTVRFFQSSFNQTVSFTFSRIPSNVVFDPNNQIVLKKATTTEVTDVAKDVAAPFSFALEQNFPNPFNPNTLIRYQLPQRMAVELRLYDILGSDMGTIVSGIQDAGVHSVVWNAGNYASGTYFCTMKAGFFEETKRLVLLK